MGRIAVCVMAIFAVSTPAQLAIAQNDFEAHRLQQQLATQNVRTEFQAYKEQQDNEFADFLKAQWREFDTFRGKVRIKEPKPQQVPKVTPIAPAPPVAKPAPPEPTVPIPDVPAPIPAVPAPIPGVPVPIPDVWVNPEIVPPPPPQPKPIDRKSVV